MPLYPFVFEPVYRDYVWGGQRLRQKYGRTISRAAESWEICCRKEGMSVVSNGRLKGKTLQELVDLFGEELLGKGRFFKQFPLLIKVIDAKESLSVQVHPNEESPLGEPKSECWILLEEGPLYIGLKRPISPEEFFHSPQDFLQKIDAKIGDAFFIPGGEVHAIGAGCMVFEVQQNSDTTFRIYDWGRIHRTLHLEEARQCIQWQDFPKKVFSNQLISDSRFTVERLTFSRGDLIEADPKTFQIFFSLQEGKTWLVAAESLPLTILQDGDYLKISI